MYFSEQWIGNRYVLGHILIALVVRNLQLVCHQLENSNLKKFKNSNSNSIFSHLFSFPFQLEARQVIPPFKPRIEDQYGLGNFDPQFTNEPVVLTPDDP